MNVLLTGSGGYIGRHLAKALLDRGHDVVCVTRVRPRQPLGGASYITLDYNQAVEPGDWTEATAKADIVVNAVGILSESAGQTFDTIHRAAPSALFRAAAAANISHVIQISALGADAEAQTAYHRSKKAGDDALKTLALRWTIVQPSLVYGPDGNSARFFTMFASMPVIFLPGNGQQQIQPIHIDDLIRALIILVESTGARSRCLAAVGPYAVSLRELYEKLHKALGLSGKPRFVSVPRNLMLAGAALTKWLPRSLLSTDTLAMLERGNTAPSDDMTELLGHSPKAPEQFITPDDAPAMACQAKMRWLMPVLRLSIALVWIITGLVSLSLYPVQASYALLARAGTPQFLMPVALFAAAGLDIVLGLLTLLPRRSRLLWLAQAGLILAYTAIITVKLPEFWLHPYGPILKNLPLLAVLWLMYELEETPWNT